MLDFRKCPSRLAALEDDRVVLAMTDKAMRRELCSRRMERNRSDVSWVQSREMGGVELSEWKDTLEFHVVFNPPRSRRFAPPRRRRYYCLDSGYKTCRGRALCAWLYINRECKKAKLKVELFWQETKPNFNGADR